MKRPISILNSVLLSLLPVFFHKTHSEECSANHRAAALTNFVYCQPRYQVIPLIDGSFNIHNNVEKMHPGHALIKRCGGSCWSAPHSCKRLKVRNVTIPITGSIKNQEFLDCIGNIIAVFQGIIGLDKKSAHPWQSLKTYLANARAKPGHRIVIPDKATPVQGASANVKIFLKKPSVSFWARSGTSPLVLALVLAQLGPHVPLGTSLTSTIRAVASGFKICLCPRVVTAFCLW